MMANLELSVSPLVTLSSLGTSIYLWSSRAISKHRRRTNELETTEHLLGRHYKALERFLEDQKAPSNLKWELIVFSEQISDRAFALDLVRQVCQPEQSKTPQADQKGVKEFDSAVEGLRKTDAELADAFTTAVATGITAMLFRWPEGSAMFSNYIAKAVSDHRREAAIFSRAVRHGSKQNADWPDSGFGGSRPLPA